MVQWSVEDNNRIVEYYFLETHPREIHQDMQHIPIGSIRMKLQNCRYLYTGYGLENASKQNEKSMFNYVKENF